MLSISNITKSFGIQTLFSNVSFHITARDRMAIIGPNGSGKTTLFDIIAGRTSPDSGTVALRKGSTIGYLEQEIQQGSTTRLIDAVSAASTSVTGMAHRIQVLQEDLAEGIEDMDTEALLRELGELQHRYEAAGGYNAEYEAEIVLAGLGFTVADYSRPLNEFSGGWLMRAELARLLLLNPDILLLDEPTNHLDLESCIWFEGYLQSYQGAVLVTSHDRAFLNRLVNKVLALEQDDVLFHNGNYDSYVMARQKDLEVLEATVKKQERKIKREMRFIERFRAKNTKASQVQSRIKRLEKMERAAVPRSTKKIHFSFPEPIRSGSDVITLSHIHKAYNGNVVYRDLNLVLHRGDRVALVGPNGAGKTTLLKILAGVLPFEEGDRIPGYHVTTAYYAQHQLEQLEPEHSVIEELRRAAPDETDELLRTVLGGFLFSGDDVFKPVSVLSGGEKARLALARILMNPANLLLMDEPTNHLDIASREILTDALEAYHGTLCFITHDRTLISQTANKIVGIDKGHVHVFPGDYDSYLYRKESRDKDAPVNVKIPDSRTGKDISPRLKAKERKRLEGEIRNSYFQRSNPIKQRIAEIEAEIAQLESRFKELERQFSNEEHYQDKAQVVDSIEQHSVLRGQIQSLTEEWEQLSLEAERLKSEFEEDKRRLEMQDAA